MPKPHEDLFTTEEARARMTLVRPDASTRRDAATPSGFPSDLFEQARGRLRLLVTFFIIAFGFDLVIFAGTWLYVKFTGGTIPADGNRIPAAQWINLGAVVTSVALWWAAGSRRVSASRLHTWGLTYEVIICFICSLLPYWQYYIDHQLIPQLTWVPAIVIMFPLIMPGPPRRMLMAAVASAAMAPFALLVLQLTGRVDLVDGSPYVPATVGSAFAVGFAYVGARVVYGLGREVARARALGSYQLEEQLGAGGMGEVWRARHRLLARPAAIKLIRPSLAGSTSAVVSEEARRRFEREAQAIAGLRSPHTVHLFDFGIADDGAFYYAMELLEGLDADALVRRFGPIPAERAVHLLRQVCHSLSEAESRGLVHRDVKPSNIFVCRYGEDHDFVKVLDFGIVKTRDDTTETPDPLTSEAVIRGTPAFMAPEQALGAAELDGRADIYAVGCVAYWLLTGQMVFAADSRAALLMHHIQTVPVAPSARTELPVPAELDEVVLACLAKDPAARPQSARELSVRLDELKLEAWTEARAREWWERHRPDERAAS